MATQFDWSKTIAELPGNPVPKEWTDSKGKGVKTAFIDTGANLGLNSLRHLNVGGRKFFVSAPGFSVDKLTGQDPVGEAFGVAGHGHGTLYASLLAGKIPQPTPADKDVVSGIAPDAEVYLIKATDASGELTTIRQLLHALELCANLGIEIAITGQCIARAEMEFEPVTDADIDRVFALPGVQKMFIFAPLKNREAASFWTDIVAANFPSHRPEVFNVACIPGTFEQVFELIQQQNIPFLLAGFNGEVLTKNGNAIPLTETESEESIHFRNSAATAIMGALAVLALSVFKQNNAGALPTREVFGHLLGSVCRPLEDAFGEFIKPALFRNL